MESPIHPEKSFELLYEISRAIVSDRYLEEILILVVTLTADLMNSKICSLMLVDEEAGHLAIKATQSLSERYRTKPPVKIGESVSGRAVIQKKPIIVNDILKDKDYKFPEIAEAEGLKAMISVPMMIKGRVTGVLNCYTSEPHDFNKEEIRILTGVANQAALAIENTKLLAEKVNAVEKLEVRKLTEKAKGLLMTRYGFTEAEAYHLIQKQSMERRKSIKEIAEAILVAEEIKTKQEDRR